MNPLDLCRSTLTTLTRQGFLSTYERSGRFQPSLRDKPGVPKEMAKLFWYARNDGDLYRDKLRWRAAYRLVDSFRQERQNSTRQHLKLNDAFGRLPVPLPDMQRFLGTAFTALGFRLLASDEALQTAWFGSDQSCKVEDLPEPYGKWLQIVMARPCWEQSAQLAFRAECRLTPQGNHGCGLSLITSTIATPLLDTLAAQIGDFTGQATQIRDLPASLTDHRLAWLTNGPLPG